MLTSKPGQVLLVGRDRAHVRELAQKYPGEEVISASAFFDRVRILGFLTNDKTRDDHAPLIMAQKILLKNKRYPLRMAQNFASLYSSFFHGTSTPTDVLGMCSKEHGPVLEILAQIEAGLAKKSLCNGVEALYHAWLNIKHKKLMPPGLLGVSRVCLYYLVDLTLLEIEVVKELSRLGLGFNIELPMDFMARGINVAVDFCAKQFESEPDVNIELSFDNIASEGPLLPLVNALFTEEKLSLGEECLVVVASDILQEADQISSSIANILSKNPKAQVALTLRSLDQRSLTYFRSLARHGLSVKGRKGQVLSESPAGVLLATLISARLNNLAKAELVGLINHPVFIYNEPDHLKRMHIQLLVEDLGIDDRLIRVPGFRYRVQMDKLSATVKDQEPAKLLLELLDKIESLLLLIPLTASFHGHLTQSLRMMEKVFDPFDPSFIHMQQALSTMANSQAFSAEDPHMSLLDFSKLLKAELKKVTIATDHGQANAVEFLLLPELLGRTFDHVFIADITAGRMPQNQVIDPLMDDQARISLNKLMKKPLLRIYFDDPFEPMPVPPRQALEPFWFASAVASAKKSVHFSHALRDELGQEQAPSEFFVWLLSHDGKPGIEHSFKTPGFKRFLAGIFDQDSDAHNEQKVAKTARKRAFLEQIPHEQAFLVNEKSIQESFLGRIGSNQPQKALTPTMVEAFAGCSFKGFSERILKLKRANLDQDDVDARLLGQVAHEVLEQFFSQPQRDAFMLKEILAKVSKDFSKDHFIKNELVFLCHVEWLLDLLSGLISRLEELSLDISGQVVAKEVDFGLSAKARPGVLITVDERRYLLGGRVDRIDRVNNGWLVLDYKLSSTDSLKLLMSPRQMLNNHFQVPMYLRLVKENLSKDEEVEFCLASIRDGQLTFMKKDQKLWDRIMNDRLEDSMARKIDEIFRPIALGEILAKKGEHCSHCDFAYLCRKDAE